MWWALQMWRFAGFLMPEQRAHLRSKQFVLSNLNRSRDFLVTLSCEAIWQWRRRLLKSGAAFLEVLAVFEKVRIRRIGNWIRLSRILEMKKKSELTWLLLDAMLWGPCLVCQWACHRGWNCVPWRCTSQIPTCQITDKFNYKIRIIRT